MTDTNLGAAAGDIFAKAFTLGYETGRNYVPVGGMALTAEQVEDVRTVSNCAMQYGNIASREAAYRLAVRFPATEPAEPAEPATQSAGGDCFDVCEGHPAPAEPAEEETKALPAEVGSRIRASVTRWSSALEWPDSNPYIDTFVLSGSGFWDAENDQFTVVPSCFSYIEVLEVLPPPVAPAPAETGPWQRIEDVPESVYLIKDCEGDKWRRDRKSWEVYSERGFRWHPGFPDRFAPFVAAEEG